MSTTQLLIVGVGGQGLLLTSRVLGALASQLGLDVKVSEVHGMAQRGGSVVTHVKFGEKIDSPLVELGEADCILAFEELEGLRWAGWLKKGGLLAVNRQQMLPMPVLLGAAEYPQEAIRERLAAADVKSIDALALAREAGNEKSMNMAMLGLVSTALSIPQSAWMTAIEFTVPPKTIAVNQQAFLLGAAAK